MYLILKSGKSTACSPLYIHSRPCGMYAANQLAHAPAGWRSCAPAGLPGLRGLTHQNLPAVPSVHTSRSFSSCSNRYTVAAARPDSRAAGQTGDDAPRFRRETGMQTSEDWGGPDVHSTGAPQRWQLFPTGPASPQHQPPRRGDEWAPAPGPPPRRPASPESQANNSSPSQEQQTPRQARRILQDFEEQRAEQPGPQRRRDERFKARREQPQFTAPADDTLTASERTPEPEVPVDSSFFDPSRSFEQLGLHPRLVSALQSAGLAKPSRVQVPAISPHLLVISF